MAFCGNCGKPIPENGICSCQLGKAPAAPQGQPVMRPQGAPQGQPQMRPQGAPAAPQGQPQMRPQGAPQGQPQARPQGAPQGQPQVRPQGQPQMAAPAAPAPVAPAAPAPAAPAAPVPAAPAGFTPASAAPAAPAPAAPAAPASPAATPGTVDFGEVVGVFKTFLKTPAQMIEKGATGEIKTMSAMVWGGIYVVAALIGFLLVFLKTGIGFGTSLFDALVSAISVGALIFAEAGLIFAFGKNKEAGYMTIVSTLCADTCGMSCLLLVMGIFSLIWYYFALVFGLVFFGMLAVSVYRTFKRFATGLDENMLYWFSIVLIAVAVVMQGYIIYEVLGGALLSAVSSH